MQKLKKKKKKTLQAWGGAGVPEEAAHRARAGDVCVGASDSSLYFWLCRLAGAEVRSALLTAHGPLGTVGQGVALRHRDGSLLGEPQFPLGFCG